MKTRNEKHGVGWKRVLLAAVLMLVGVAAPARAAGLLVADGGFGGVLEVESQEVVVTVNNGIAVTEVTQTFRNTEDRVVEALYTFPVPKGASVANFSMWINGKEMVGEVVEKKRAREIYESYKQTKRDPGLLEQKDYKTFEMRIFPIPARGEQKVKIRYYQQLEFDNDWGTYVYPLSTVTHDGKKSRTTGTFSFTLHVRSNIPIVEMQSPSHKDEFIFTNHGKEYRQASFEMKGGDLNRDIVVAYRIERPATGMDVLFSKQGAEDGYFCLTMTAGKELAEKSGAMDYVVLLDISGSMGDESKLRISRNCIKEFISQLGPDDHFEIMTFNISPTPLFNALTKADEKSKKAAADFLDSRRAQGGTVLLPAVQTAYKYRSADRPLNIVVFSDGMTEQAERKDLLTAIGNRPSNAKFFCVGVGNEINRDLLTQLAEDAGGLAAFLSLGDDFERQAKAFRRKLTRPAVSNLKIKIDGVGSYDIEPDNLPNLFHGSPLWMYGRYAKAGKGSITVEGEINGVEFKETFQVDFPREDTANPEIRRMWAWNRIQRLTRMAGKTGGSGTAEEIVRLGEGYSIATEYTSFIVLENDAEYQRWQIARKNTLLVAKDRQARQKLMTELEKMRNKSLADLGPQDKQTKQNKQTPMNAPQSRSMPSSPIANPSSSSGGSSGNSFSLTGKSGGGPVGPVGLTIIAGLVVSGFVAKKSRQAKGE